MKVKEFCCGCTLRTGTLILLWLGAILNCLAFLGYLIGIFHQEQISQMDGGTVRSMVIVYYFLQCAIATVICIIGIVGVQKNNKKFIVPFYYYFIYLVVFAAIAAIILIFDWELYTWIFNPTSAKPAGKGFEDKVIALFAIIAVDALQVYFTVVVKSYIDVVENDGFSASAPDPSAVGYRNA